MLLLFSADLKFSSMTQIQSRQVDLLPWAGLSWVISHSVTRIVATSSAPLNVKTAVLYSSSFLGASAIKHIMRLKKTQRRKWPSQFPFLKCKYEFCPLYLLLCRVDFIFLTETYESYRFLKRLFEAGSFQTTGGDRTFFQ